MEMMEWFRKQDRSGPAVGYVQYRFEPLQGGSSLVDGFEVWSRQIRPEDISIGGVDIVAIADSVAARLPIDTVAHVAIRIHPDAFVSFRTGRNAEGAIMNPFRFQFSKGMESFVDRRFRQAIKDAEEFDNEWERQTDDADWDW